MVDDIRLVPVEAPAASEDHWSGSIPKWLCRMEPLGWRPNHFAVSQSLARDLWVDVFNWQFSTKRKRPVLWRTCKFFCRKSGKYSFLRSLWCSKLSIFRKCPWSAFWSHLALHKTPTMNITSVVPTRLTSPATQLSLPAGHQSGRPLRSSCRICLCMSNLGQGKSSQGILLFHWKIEI